MAKEINKTYQEFKVKIEGMKPLLFNKFCGMEGEYPPEQRLHFDGKKVIVPADLIYAFFFQEKPGGCCQRFEGKAYKKIAKTGIAYMAVSPEKIPIMHNGKEVVFNGFDKNGKDTKAGMSVVESTITNPKPMITRRPQIELPWELEFQIRLYKNDLIMRDKIYNWLMRGGIEVGLGSYRPRYGQFIVKEFEEVKIKV